MKSCLFLVFSILSFSSILGGIDSLWFSYFVSMLFLSGVFVILVYFSSLSKFYFFRFPLPLSFFIVLASLSLSSPTFSFLVSDTLGVIFSPLFILPIVFIIISLVLFLLFLSFFLNFGGGLRSF